MVKQNIYIILLGLKLLFILLSGILFTVSLNETLDDSRFISNFNSYWEKENLTSQKGINYNMNLNKKWNGRNLQTPMYLKEYVLCLLILFFGYVI